MGFGKPKESLRATGFLSLLTKATCRPCTPEGAKFLPKATAFALEKLNKRPEGFFMLVEGSQIDFGGHANDKDYIINEVLDFDRTIGGGAQLC
jgi:hypothetical protein